MKRKCLSFKIADILYLSLAVLPLVGGMILKILTATPKSGITISGARIYFIIPLPLQNLPITESQVNSVLVILSILGLCLFLTHGIAAYHGTRRQQVAEWMVETCEQLVSTNMGAYFESFPPFIAGILALSAVSSFTTLVGLYPPTADINIVGGWAVLIFIVITYYRWKCGPLHYLKSFAQPVFLTPLNIISEIATPVSMAFRHYGNILSGAVISVLLAAGLQGLSSLIFGWLPGILGEFPFLQIGLPAILSLYFDIFSGILQAFIFAMLSMLYIAGAFPADVFEKRRMSKHKHAE